MPLNPAVPDWRALFLGTSTNAHTHRARRGDLEHFEAAMGLAPEELLILSSDEANRTLTEYRTWLHDRGQSAATIKRRLATLRAWLRFCFENGATQVQANVPGTMPQITSPQARPLEESTLARLLALPDPTTLRGRRDSALLGLISEVPLWNWQLCALRVDDFLPSQQRLLIPLENVGAMRVTAREYSAAPRQRLDFTAPLSPVLCQAIAAHLQSSAHHANAPLFCNLDRRTPLSPQCLTPKSVLKIVKGYGARAGCDITARDLRVTAIAKALGAQAEEGLAHERFPHVSYGTWDYYRSDNRSIDQREKSNGKENLFRRRPWRSHYDCTHCTGHGGRDRHSRGQTLF